MLKLGKKRLAKLLTHPIAFFVFYLALVITKNWYFLTSGRFWAEEANIWYANLYEASFLRAIFFIPKHMSQYVFINNIISYTATQIPFKYAPLVTTYTSQIVQAIPLFLLVKYRHHFDLKSIYIYGLLCISAGIPQSDEVWANATNVFWHLSILATLILALPPVGGRAKYVLFTLLFVAGLSGFSIVFLLPLFLLKYAFMHRDREILGRTLIAAFTATVQIIVFLSIPSSRSFELAPVTSIFALITQQVVSPALGENLTGEISNFYIELINHQTYSVLPIVIISFVIVLSIYTVLIKTWNLRLYLLVLGALALTAGHVLGALDNKEALISAVVGGRYFYAGNMLFFIAIAVAAPKNTFLKTYFAIVVFTSLVMGITIKPWGPDWQQSLAWANEHQRARVEVWPAGWYVPNFSLDEE